MLSNRFSRLLACVALAPLAMTAAQITEPIEFNVDYELWGFSPVVECGATPEKTGTFITSHCYNLGVTAYAGRFTLEIGLDDCTLHFWNQTGCEGGQLAPVALVGNQGTSCLSLALEPSRLPGRGNPPTDLVHSVEVTCPNISK